MDELQAVFIKNKLFIYGISSDAGEIFTPIERLEKICIELFLKKLKRKVCDIQIDSAENIIIAPPSMKLPYNQFNLKKLSAKIFAVNGVELDEDSIIGNYLSQEKKHGVLFGDSYELFRMCLKFSFSLVLRQRFIPFYKDAQSHFAVNLDNTEDYGIFMELVNKSPLSIKPKISDTAESILRESLDYFVNLIIASCLSDVDINFKRETATDEWVSGLLGRNIRLNEEIQEGLKQWLITRKINHNLGYNMLFKLIEPTEEDNEWKIIFNVQSKKDPSLIINLHELWHNPKKFPVKNLKVYLLMDLGIAAKFSKTIEKALYKQNPHDISISSNDALYFIANESFLLKDAGFVVQIPKITYAKADSIRVKIRFKDDSRFMIKGTGTMGTALFDFDYSVAVGDIELSEEEFYQLSKAKEKLVNVKGRWVEVNEDDIKRVIDYFNKKEKFSLADAFRANTYNESGFGIEQINVPKRFEEKINGLFDFNGINDIDVPPAFSGSLRKYQVRGFSWMLFLRNIGFGGILADDMGLGKTIQAIAYLLSSKQENPSLVICPTSVLDNWQRELEKFSPSIRVHIHHGSKRLGKNQFKKGIEAKDLVISSYATARKDEETLNEVEWDTILLDEAQNIKNPFAKQTASISRLKSGNRFCLTGTPIENRLSELWSIMSFANPGFLSNWKSFKDNFAEPIELQNDNNKIEILKKIISPFILRRLKTDKKIINDLPEKTEIKEYCKLTEEQASLYQAIVDSSLKEIEKESEKRRALIMAALIKLKQVCNHPSNYLKDSNKLLERSGKVNRLREIIDVILQNNEKCLIFTQFKEMGDLLKTDIENYFDAPICFLHGQQNRKTRQQLIDCFQSDDINSPKIFILSLKAGGLGINLTKANHVIHFDRWWNPAVENQATDRAFRIGQQKNVFVYKFINTGTIEEKIDEMIEKKRNLSDSMLSKGEITITELDNAQLLELFSLRKEHVG